MKISWVFCFFFPQFSWFWVRALVFFKETTTKLLEFWWRPLCSLASFINDFSFAGICPPLKIFWVFGMWKMYKLPRRHGGGYIRMQHKSNFRLFRKHLKTLSNYALPRPRLTPKSAAMHYQNEKVEHTLFYMFFCIHTYINRIPVVMQLFSNLLHLRILPCKNQMCRFQTFNTQHILTCWWLFLFVFIFYIICYFTDFFF